jgi:actin-related protein
MFCVNVSFNNTFFLFLFCVVSIGRPKHIRVMAGALEGDLFVGPKAEEHRGLLSIRYPMEHGIVTDWNDMERIWQYIYSKDQLQTFSEEVIYEYGFE